MRLAAFLLAVTAGCWACTVWQHQWRVIHETSHEGFDPTVIQVVRGMVPSDHGAPSVVFLGGGGFASAPANTGETGFTTLLLPPDRQFPSPEELQVAASVSPCLLVDPQRMLTTQRWMVDDSLPQAALVRWECLSRCSVRWVCLASEGSPLSIDETPMITGFIITVSALPWLNPVVRFERYLGRTDRIASISWMAALLPRTGTETEFVEAQEFFTPR